MAAENEKTRITVAQLFSEHLQKGTTPEQLGAAVVESVGLSGASSVFGLRTVGDVLKEMAEFGFVKRDPTNDSFRYSGKGANIY